MAEDGLQSGKKSENYKVNHNNKLPLAILKCPKISRWIVQVLIKTKSTKSNITFFCSVIVNIKLKLIRLRFSIVVREILFSKFPISVCVTVRSAVMNSRSQHFISILVTYRTRQLSLFSWNATIYHLATVWQETLIPHKLLCVASTFCYHQRLTLEIFIMCALQLRLKH